MDNNSERSYGGIRTQFFKRQWPMRYRSAKYCPLAKKLKMDDSERGDWGIRNLFLGHPRPMCYRSANVLSINLADLLSYLKSSAIE